MTEKRVALSMWVWGFVGSGGINKQWLLWAFLIPRINNPKETVGLFIKFRMQVSFQVSFPFFPGETDKARSVYFLNLIFRPLFRRSRVKVGLSPGESLLKLTTFAIESLIWELPIEMSIGLNALTGKIHLIYFTKQVWYRHGEKKQIEWGNQLQQLEYEEQRAE